MNIKETAIKGLLIIEPKVFNDGRGYFYESFNKHKYAGAGIDVEFVQDNQSFSQKGAVRGLHGQADPFAQGKLVRVISGSVLDIALDIRKDSPTYGQYLAIELKRQQQPSVLDTSRFFAWLCNAGRQHHFYL